MRSQISFRVNQKGISPVELLIAGVIATIVGLSAVSLVRNFGKAAKVSEAKLIAVGEDLVGSRALWTDLRRAGLSFNLLNGQLDDSGRPFFDFLPDRICSANCSRKITLDKNSRHSLIIATSRGGLAPPIAISPLGFYDQVESTNASMNGRITFNENRFRDVMQAIDPATSDEQRMFIEGRVLRFYSPFYHRREVMGGRLDLNVPPRMFNFVGVVRNNRIERLNLPELGRQVRPDLGSDISGIDRFFRFLPPSGGSGVFGLVTRVELIRYSVRKIRFNGRESGELVRETFDGTKFTNARVIVSPLRSLTLSRADISKPGIRHDFQIDKKEYREIMNVKERK